MAERLRLALRIILGRATIIHVSEHFPLHGNVAWGYLVAPTYDHASDWLAGNTGEDVITRTVHVWEG